MLPRPHNFSPPGRIISAQIVPDEKVPPVLVAKRRMRGARAAGKRYEAKAKAHFENEYGERYLSGPWISFTCIQGRRFCQPDGILLDLRNLTCICTEMKIQHCDLSWWQLYFLYIPVLQKVFPHLRFIGVEVCKWYDSAIKTSGPVSLCKNIEEPLNFSEAQYPSHFVHILRV